MSELLYNNKLDIFMNHLRVINVYNERSKIIEQRLDEIIKLFERFLKINSHKIEKMENNYNIQK